ncbi:MAG: hypothetical protein NC311_15370 [Muribaculaceae bacterium]|nr:hypothetical protein [Muribaculaceae bacterium]
MARTRNEADILLGLKYDKQIHRLNDHDLAALVRAIYDMRLRGSTDEQMTPQAEMLFSIVYDEVEENAENYEQIKAERSKAANARWEKVRASKAANAHESVATDPQIRNASGQSEPADMQTMQMHANDARASSDMQTMQTMLIDKIGVDRNRSDLLPPTSSNELVSPLGGEVPASDPEPPEPVADEKPKPRRKNSAGLTKAQEARFDRWYDAYPKKVAPGEAQKAWKRLDPDDQQTEVMIRAVQTQLEKDRRFTEGYIPNPATWLNRREWENNYDGLSAPTQNTQRRPMNNDATDWGAYVREHPEVLDGDDADAAPT